MFQFRVEISQKWKQLPAEEKEQYVVTDRCGQSSVSEEELLELVRIDTRCSPDRFRSLVADFSDEKKAACSAIGFDVLLKMSGRKIHHSMLRVLVDSVDPNACTITMHGKKIEMDASDFENVMGLKNAGSEVDFKGSTNDHPELMAIINSLCGKDNKINLRDVQNYMKDTEEVDNKFKRLFVLFTMSTILSPSASLTIPKKWLLALKDTRLISSLNWADYSFKCLMEAIVSFKKESQSYCSGCVLFLQLFYFDCVSHGKTIVDKSLYPVEA
ncbi:hypothetical protein RchiOBHm_Chr7g0204351 [Rosa chinensis]|uniref:Uncharacterized protein n=1 Tax=Rosa chinensis TaxID=74649 RepID=A0A2P6P8N7_ROSCH|nr:hypothetical protein RchiOBHm_Chr7g0204351 [Rosa chinensis]